MNPSETPCTIIIPTYNGREILEECLPSVIEEMKRRNLIDELLVVDNASVDRTAEMLAEKFPLARVMTLDKNMKIFAINPAAREAMHRHLFFLNNDMLLEPGCIDSLMAGFDDMDVFAVTGKVMQWDRKTEQAARRKAVYRRGMFWYLPWPGPDEQGVTIHALGGQSIFDREKFLSLDGIDPLFSPFYHEDLDISYRAYRRGWRVVYKPDAVMIHKGAATASRIYTRKQLDAFMKKNMFLFIWKNIHDPALFMEHLLSLPPRTVAALLKGDTAFLKGLAGAIGQLSDVSRSRADARSTSRVPDSRVLELLDPDRKS